MRFSGVCLTAGLVAAALAPAAPSRRSTPPASARARTPAAAASVPDADLFRAKVRPILSTRCAPCHEPGGRMYPRLPFDDPAVVAARAHGIERRLRPAEKVALQSWLATLPKARSPDRP